LRVPSSPSWARAGPRLMRFQDLRHPFGSLLIQAGASLAYVRGQDGALFLQVTADVYGHAVPGANISFVDRLDALKTPQQSAMTWGRKKSGKSRKSLRIFGWEAGIRTPIRRSRVCSLTVRRPPNGRPNSSKQRNSYSKSIRAITICGITLFQLSGIVSKGRRKGLVSPAESPPALPVTIGVRWRSTTWPYGS
jgi:hypothetical protein